jgi:Uma2 family endonuclease
MDNSDVAGTISHMDRVHIGPPEPRGDDHTRDHVVVLRNLSWPQYKALSDAREKSRPKLTFLEGVLEVMTKGQLHEVSKTFVARLLEIYAVECNVELIGARETTWEDEAKKVGVEADECYFLDKIGNVPDLVIEVVVTSGGIDKLEVYRRLGVREVWFWIDDRFWLYALVNGEYVKIRVSRVVPGFDFDEVAQIVLTTETDHQTAGVRAYRDALRARQ